MGYKVGPLRREFAMEPGASEHPIVDDRAPRDAQARGGFIEFQATHEAQPRHARCTRCKRIEPIEGIDDGRAQVGGGRAFEPKLKEIELDAAATGGGARTPLELCAPTGIDDDLPHHAHERAEEVRPILERHITSLQIQLVHEHGRVDRAIRALCTQAMPRHAMDLGIDLVPQLTKGRQIPALPPLQQAIDDPMPLGRTGKAVIGWLDWFVGGHRI